METNKMEYCTLDGVDIKKAVAEYANKNGGDWKPEHVTSVHDEGAQLARNYAEKK